MGIEWLILAVWAAQVLVVLALVLLAAFRREWAAGAGQAVGLAIALVPLLSDQSGRPDPGAFVFGTSLVMVAVSAIVLVISYSFTRRWIALLLVIVIFCIPIIYMFIPAFSPLKVYPRLEAMAEIDFFLSPIACALAGREIFVWVRRLSARSKEGVA